MTTLDSFALPGYSVFLALLCFNSMSRVSKKAHLIATIVLFGMFAYYASFAWSGFLHDRFEDQIRVGAAAVVMTITGWTAVSLIFNKKTWEEPIWPRRPVRVEDKGLEVTDGKVDLEERV